MSESLFFADEDFEAFYLRHYKMVYRICFTYMKNSHDYERKYLDGKGQYAVFSIPIRR